MSFYQNSMKNTDSSNSLNSFQSNSHDSDQNILMKSLQKMNTNKNHSDNLLSIIKTENSNPQLSDLDAVSSLYNKLLINNNQNAQFQLEQQQNTLMNSMQNKIIDFI